MIISRNPNVTYTMAKTEFQDKYSKIIMNFDTLFFKQK